MRSTHDRRQVTLALAATALAPAIAVFVPRMSTAQESSPEASPEASPSASPVAGDELEIGAYDIYFDPKEVTIKADTEMEIKVKNHGVTQHTFLIDDHKNENLPFDPIKLVVDPGKTEETKLKAPAGKYYFWCDIPGHEAAGMWGYITAE
ncbi:MAG: cupredoxin domain-containing protein [Chloroflexia bacterium]|nr:cupredoxin domain-containing protein [Chloroflexia bacterium]